VSRTQHEAAIDAAAVSVSPAAYHRHNPHTNICSCSQAKELTTMELVFEPTTTSPVTAWMVRDASTGVVLGRVEWLEGIGVFGLGVLPGADLFASPSRLQEVGRFLDEVNAR
jgi:hypothetical protein